MKPLKPTGGGGVFDTRETALLIGGGNYSLSSHSLREQLADLYQAIHSSANMTLLPQYEEVIQSLISQSLDNRLECEQLEISLKR